MALEMAGLTVNSLAIVNPGLLSMCRKHSASLETTSQLSHYRECELATPNKIKDPTPLYTVIYILYGKEIIGEDNSKKVTDMATG